MESVELFSGKKIRAVGEHVLLEFERDFRELISSGGIIEPDKQNSSRFIAKVVSVGDKVDLTEWDFSVGDVVIFNNYDIKYLEEHESKQIYGIVKPQSVMAVYSV